MKRMNRFYVVSYGNDSHYVYYGEWVLRSIFGIKYIHFLGMSFTGFRDYREAVRFRNQKRSEYLHAKKMISR